jgi:hypothetical protein
MRFIERLSFQSNKMKELLFQIKINKNEFD